MDFEIKWQNAILSQDATILEAIKSLDAFSFQIVLITSPDGRLQGTITDGDIRRGLLRGLTLDHSVEEILNTEPFVVPPQMDRDVVLHTMDVNRIHQMPIVDRDRRVVGLHLLDRLKNPALRENIMVIMAGGLGTRLRPHTVHCPKPLLPVAGKPMLEHIIERAKLEGFQKIILAIGYLGQMIEDYFGHGALWNIEIDYIRETRPLGTAGALSLLETLPTRPFVVTNGDVLTDIHYAELLDFHEHSKAHATMAVRMHELKHPFGVVQVKGLDIVAFEEKPCYRSNVNAGVYVLNPEVLSFLQPNEHCDMPMLFERLMASKKRAIVYPAHESWLDIGQPNDYDQVKNAMSL